MLRISPDPFDPGAETSRFIAEGYKAGGAAVTFTGLVRSDAADPLTALTLECYPELATEEIGRFMRQAITRFELLQATVIHRYGELHPGEPIVQVMTLAQHRQAAFAAAEYLMDYLKTGAPFWKKETTATGAHWVDARPEDDESRNRWSAE